MDVSVVLRGHTKIKKPSSIVCRKFPRRIFYVIPCRSHHLISFSTGAFPESMCRQATVPNAERANMGDISQELGSQIV